jgi:hypothetical protein
MRGSKGFALLLCGLLLVLQACCCMNGQCGAGGGAQDHAQPAADAAVAVAHAHTRVCAQHPEPPFDFEVKPPGPGIVYGTGDFDGGGAVLIKLQIQDLATIDGNEGTITAWSGNGDPPSSSASFPTPASAYFNTGGDVALPFWTSHVLRDYDTATNKYWVAVKVDHKKTNGSREVRYLFWTWTPTTTPAPDTLRNFNEYP